MFSLFSFLYSPSSSEKDGNEMSGDQNIPSTGKKSIIFDDEDQYLLCEADAIKNDAILWMREAQSYMEELKEILQIIETTEPLSDERNKALKKANKTELKMIQRQTDALEYFELSNDMIYIFYRKHYLDFIINADNESVFKGSQLMEVADNMWKTAKLIKEKGYMSDLSVDVIDFLIKALIFEEDAISIQEEAFMSLTNSEWDISKSFDYPIFNNRELPREEINAFQTHNSEIICRSNKDTLFNFKRLQNPTDKINNKSYPTSLNYKIQIGSYNQNANEISFKGIQPVSTEKNESGFNRFMAGNFKSYETVVRALEILKNSGFRDAFVVAYANDLRLGPGIKFSH